MRKLALMIPLALLLGACGPSVADLAESRSAEVKPILEQIDKASNAAKENKDTATGFTMPEGEKLSFKLSDAGTDALLIQPEKFDKSDSADNSYLDLVASTDWLDDLKSVYAGDIDEYTTTDQFSGNCDTAAGMKYVVVVRSKSFQAGRVVDDTTFEPGSWVADLLLYELSSGKCLGVVEVSAASSPDIYSTYNTPTEELESDLRDNARKSITESLEPYSDTIVFN